MAKDNRTTTRRSPGYCLVEQVWNHLKAKSWIRINHAMATALQLAVDAGMEFSQADMANIANRMRGQYWLHLEPLYTKAVKADNLSACKSIEHALERRPWILGSQRLTVGAETPWGIVTSLKDERLIACEYEGPRQTGKPKKRTNVTREMLAAENGQERAARKLTVTCVAKHCGRVQPDHRTNSAWHQAGKRPRRPVDRCVCGEKLPPTETV